MGREVGDLAEQPGVKEDQVPPVVDAQVSIPAYSRHIEAVPARESVAGAGDRVDHTPIERKEKQVFEARRKVPARPGLVEDAVTSHRGVAYEALSQIRDGRDVLVLNTVAVVPEVGVGLQHGGGVLEVAGRGPGMESIGGRRR